MDRDSPEARLERWKKRWEVVDPDIRCHACGGSQSIFVPSSAFNRHHARGCLMQSELPQYPKHDLVQILKAFQRKP
jgi:hypothetical protein